MFCGVFRAVQGVSELPRDPHLPVLECPLVLMIMDPLKGTAPRFRACPV